MLSRAKNAVRNGTVRIAAARPFWCCSDHRLNIVSASDYSRCVPVRRED